MSCMLGIFGMLGMAKGLFAPAPAAAAAPQGLEAAVELEFVDGKALLQAFVVGLTLGAGGVAVEVAVAGLLLGVVFFLAPMTKKRVEPEAVTP